MILSGNLDGTPEVVGSQVVYPRYGQFRLASGVLSPSILPGHVPGPTGTWVTTYQMVLNRTYYIPWIVPAGGERRLQEIFVEVTTLQASAYMKLALYRADTDFQPTQLVADFGSIDASSTGIKKIVGINLLVEGPQRYVWALNSGGSATGATYRNYRVHAPDLIPIISTMGNTTVAQVWVAQTLSAGWPSTGVKWANLDGFSNGTDALFQTFLTVWSDR